MIDRNKPGFFSSTQNLIVSLSVVIAFGATVFAFGVKTEWKDNKTLGIEIKVDTLSARMDKVLNTQLELKKTLEEQAKSIETQSKAIDANTKATKAGNSALANHLKLSNKIDELYQFMQKQKDEDEKKNYSSENVTLR
jgi:hypothetical protein